MSEEKKRFVYVRDQEKTREGFATYEAAKAVAATIPETEDQRVRVRFRTRTSLWDVIVKGRKEAKELVHETLSKVVAPTKGV